MSFLVILERVVMPREQIFWFPRHEAGHIIVAMHIRLIPDYAILRISPEVNRARTILPFPRNTSAKDECRLACGGMAAEMCTFKSGERKIFEDNLFDACLERSGDDRRKLLTVTDAAAVGVQSEIVKDNLMISFSFRNVLPIITRHLDRL